MKKLFVVLMLICSFAFAGEFDTKKLGSGEVIYAQPHPQKPGWTIVTIQVRNTDIYVVELDKDKVIRKVFYFTGQDLKLVFEAREA